MNAQTTLDQIRADADRRQHQNQAEYHFLATLTGQTIAQVERDLTAPDPAPRTRMASEFDLIRADYATCPDCGARPTISATNLWGDWYAVIDCPTCGVVAEIELDARNEASIYY